MRALLPLTLLVVACASSRNRPVSEVPSGSSEVLDTAHVDADPEDPVAGARADPASAESSSDDALPVVARVAGQPIHVDELLAAWLHRESHSVRAYIRELVVARIVMLEAARLGIEVPGSALDEARSDATYRLREEVRKAGGNSVDGFIQDRLGLNPRRYIATLREQTAIHLYSERVVRSWLLTRERAEVRVIVTEDQASMREVREALADGEDFAAVCARHSIEESKEEGGRIPPVARGTTPLSSLAFSTPVGGLGGPVQQEDRWLLLKVDARPEPISGRWDEIGPEVEASLSARAIEDPEYWQWRSWALSQYEVDMSPLLELSGGALSE